jgi:pimeloyl-ACP methyl ester carboxylesterase
VHGNHQGFYVNQMAVADFARVPDPCPALRRTTVPALVVRGGCDLVPLPVIREYRDTLPGAKLVTVSGPVTASPPITQGCTAACCSVS